MRRDKMTKWLILQGSGCLGKREPFEGGHLVLINSLNACYFPYTFFLVYL